jgi:hypothetical protein
MDRDETTKPTDTTHDARTRRRALSLRGVHVSLVLSDLGPARLSHIRYTPAVASCSLRPPPLKHFGVAVWRDVSAGQDDMIVIVEQDGVERGRGVLRASSPAERAPICLLGRRDGPDDQPKPIAFPALSDPTEGHLVVRVHRLRAGEVTDERPVLFDAVPLLTFCFDYDVAGARSYLLATRGSWVI